MISKIDIVCDQGSASYMAGRCKVTEINESEYSVCGDPYPCFIVVYDDGATLEIRTVNQCNIHRTTTSGVKDI